MINRIGVSPSFQSRVIFINRQYNRDLSLKSDPIKGVVNALKDNGNNDIVRIRYVDWRIAPYMDIIQQISKNQVAILTHTMGVGTTHSVTDEEMAEDMAKTYEAYRYDLDIIKPGRLNWKDELTVKDGSLEEYSYTF